MTKWNADVMFPSDNCFQNKILSIKAAPSNDGNPMITLECEVHTPTSYEIPGHGEVNIQGVKAKVYQAYKVFNDDGSVDIEKTEKAQERATTLLINLGIVSEDINWDNLGPIIAPLKGKMIMTCMNSRIDKQHKTPTAAQIAAAKASGKRAEGDIMKHPISGKELIKYWPNVVEIYGLVPA
jgi:hypothetical protein